MYKKIITIVIMGMFFVTLGHLVVLDSWVQKVEKSNISESCRSVAILGAALLGPSISAEGKPSADALRQLKTLSSSKSGMAYIVSKEGVIFGDADNPLFSKRKETLSQEKPKGEISRRFWQNDSQAMFVEWSAPIVTARGNWGDFCISLPLEQKNNPSHFSFILFVLALSLAAAILIKKALRPMRGLLYAIEKMAKHDYADTHFHEDAFAADSEIGIAHQTLSDMHEDRKELFEETLSQCKTLKEASIRFTRASSNVTEVSTALTKEADLLAHAIVDQAACIAAIVENSNKVSTLIIELKNGANDLARNINSIAASAEEASSSVSVVAIANEELSTTTMTSSETLANVSDSISQISTSLSNLTSTLNSMSNHCEHAKEAASKCSTQAIEGGKAMEALKQSSSKVEKVIDVISDIADQTNMLALNATIEAARAGEAGKGFSVVAKEIKELARQTAESTKFISTQIEAVESSSSQVVQNISAINEAVTKNGEVVSSIVDMVRNQQKSAGVILANMEKADSGATLVCMSSREIGTAANMIAQNSTTAAQSGEAIASRCNEVAHLSTDFNNNVVATSQGFDEILATNEEILSTADIVANSTAQLNDYSEKSMSIAEEIKESSELIDEITGKLVLRLQRYGATH